jgi:hypothetical protein
MQTIPIFFGITRSFWAAVAALTVLFDALLQALSNAETAGPVATMFAAWFGWDAETVTATMNVFGPTLAIFIAQQRMGAARPYTLRADAVTLK